MDKKYKLTEETIRVHDSTLYRIEALKDFGDVKEGDKGGFIESEENLSHDGNCWVYSNAKVYGYAKVFGNANVYGYANVYDNAKVCDNAMVYGNAWVHGNAKVYGNAIICDNAKIYDAAEVYNYAEVFGNAKVYGNAEVWGNAVVRGTAEVCRDALIKDMSDYIVFKNWWSSGRFFTWTRSNNMWKVGCFYGTGKELIEKAYRDSEISGREYKRVVDYVESVLKEIKS